MEFACVQNLEHIYRRPRPHGKNCLAEVKLLGELGRTAWAFPPVSLHTWHPDPDPDARCVEILDPDPISVCIVVC
jgi:hypothetical protein